MNRLGAFGVGVFRLSAIMLGHRRDLAVAQAFHHPQHQCRAVVGGKAAHCPVDGVRFTGRHHLVFRTALPGCNVPVQLVQSSIAPETLLPVELTRTAKPAGATYRAGGRVWRVFDARPGETALVFAEPNRTILVIGTTGRDNLEALAASLS